MLGILLVLLVPALLLAAPAAAQIAPLKIDRPPTLLVQDNGKARALVVEAVDVDVVIRGLLAETTMTMTFRNPHRRVLEGELRFPLPQGATVSGYGLDVDGRLVEGVVVEKHQARIAFEKEVRKGVDPGLVEWTRGNSFRTRVYPVPAAGTRTVMVRYVGELAGDAGQALYLLPLKFDAPVARFHLKIAVVRGAVKPTVAGGLANFGFARWEDRYVAETRRSNLRLDEDLRVALPELPAQLVAVEPDGDQTVFVIHDAPPVPDPPRKGPSPRRVGLYWDASSSRAAADKTRELELLRSLLARWGSLLVDVVVFRDRVQAPRTFVIDRGDAGQLLRFLAERPDDGGTALASLTFPARRAGAGPGSAERYDLHLLFSDGLGNIGRGLPAAAQAPLYTITDRADANHLLLGHLAASSGGEHINLTRRDPDEAAARVGADRFAFLGAEFDPAEVADLRPRARQPVTGRFHVTGRLLAPQATIVLRYGHGEQVTRRVPVTLRRTDASDTGLVARLRAQHRVAELAVFPERNKDALLRLGRRYGLVTPGTSLLVLETLEQHLEHGVEPPASRARLRQAWLARTSVLKRQRQQAQQSKLEHVVALWEARVQWWEQDFTDWRQRLRELQVKGKSNGLRARETFREEAVEAEPELAMEAPAAMPPPAPAPAPAMAPAARVQPESKKVSGERAATGATITVRPWDPKTPYLATLEAAAARGRAYQAYLDQRAGYGASPAYYLDCASWFYARGEAVLGRRVLTSILDLDLDDPALLRVVAYRLMEQDEELALAVAILEDVLALRPEEPQSHRDLALALARRGESAARWQHSPVAARRDLERAMDLLHQVVMGHWDRFDEIEVIALMELNRLIATVERLPARGGAEVRQPDLDERLRRLLDLDLRIVLSWDADLTDVDLWVIEPTGEKADYSNRLSAIGGNVSRDFTRGYGPEEYALRRLVPGSYAIKAHYYGSGQQTLTGPATVKALVYTNYGRPRQQRQELTLRLTDVTEVVEVGTVNLDGRELRERQ